VARRGCWLLLIVGLAPSASFGQGKIDAIRQQASQSDPSSTGNSKNNSGSKSGDDSSSDDDNDCSGLLLFALAAPFVLPHNTLEDDFDRDGFFPRYPYLGRYPGYMWLGNFPNGEHDEALESLMKKARTWSVRVSAENGNDFRGMNRVGVRATLDSTIRFGLTSNWNYLSESLDGGRHDATWLGDTNVTFRFAQSEWLQFYSGAGFRVMTDDTATHFGANFVYGVDWFPKKPLVISTSFDLGNLGSAFVVHARSTAGLTLKHFESFAGYDFMRIGSVNVQGPMLGLRFWY
jgi:hypothetical protein